MLFLINKHEPTRSRISYSCMIDHRNRKNTRADSYLSVVQISAVFAGNKWAITSGAGNAVHLTLWR